MFSARDCDNRGREVLRNTSRSIWKWFSVFHVTFQNLIWLSSVSFSLRKTWNIDHRRRSLLKQCYSVEDASHLRQEKTSDTNGLLCDQVSLEKHWSLFSTEAWWSESDCIWSTVLYIHVSLGFIEWQSILTNVSKLLQCSCLWASIWDETLYKVEPFHYRTIEVERMSFADMIRLSPLNKMKKNPVMIQ